jgi:septal ring factor EnvC (AmiA/AmiB activator)
MPIFTEDEKQTTTSEDFLKIMESQGKARKAANSGGGFKAAFSRISVATVILFILVIALGAIVAYGMFRVSGLLSEVDEIKTIKTQLQAMENRLDGASAENQKLKNELGQGKGQLEALRNEREKMEAEMRRRDEERKKAAAAAAQKKPVPPPNKPKKPQPF